MTGGVRLGNSKIIWGNDQRHGIRVRTHQCTPSKDRRRRRCTLVKCLDGIGVFYNPLNKCRHVFCAGTLTRHTGVHSSAKVRPLINGFLFVRVKGGRQHKTPSQGSTYICIYLYILVEINYILRTFTSHLLPEPSRQFFPFQCCVVGSSASPTQTVSRVPGNRRWTSYLDFAT